LLVGFCGDGESWDREMVVGGFVLFLVGFKFYEIFEGRRWGGFLELGLRYDEGGEKL